MAYRGWQAGRRAGGQAGGQAGRRAGGAMLRRSMRPGGQGRAGGEQKTEGSKTIFIFYLQTQTMHRILISMEYITADELKAYLHYNPDTGVFTARKACGRRPVGRVLGSKTRHGYVQVSVGSRSYTAQRLAWLYTHGKWPDGVVDHINRARDDNRICNLRCVNYSQNALNTEYTTSKAKTRGVTYAPPWKATIQVNGKRKDLGRFHTLEEAVAARKAAEEKYKV